MQTSKELFLLIFSIFLLNFQLLIRINYIYLYGKLKIIMKTYTIICLLALIQLCHSQENKHGIIFTEGFGFLRNATPAHNDRGTAIGQSDFKSTFGLGYKVRYSPSKLYFYDFDLSVGIKKTAYDYHIDSSSDSFSFSGKMAAKYASIDPTINVKFFRNVNFFRNIYFGAGLAPTIYHSFNLKFDSPFILKIGYEHEIGDLAFIYKHGLFNTLDMNSDFQKGKINEVLFQLFISF
jgi:hypothetical protein